MAYSRLPTQLACDCERCIAHDSPNPKCQYRFINLAYLLASVALNIVFLVYIGFRPVGNNGTSGDITNFLYSPAQSALRYETRVFDSAFGIQTTPYQGLPAEENNQLWSELYNFGISRISADEARSMVNKTLPIPNDSGHYIVSLSVFHQLHCLNQVRKGLYGDVDWTDVSDHNGITHLDHCVDIIRQSLMCNADITPLTFTRARDGTAKEVAEVIHQCRDFDAIQEWAKARKMRVTFNRTKIVTDDPLGWGDYHVDY